MDLNEFLHRHQVSLMMAEAAACRAASTAHRGLAASYARRICTMRRTSGAAFPPVRG